ncbi:hypothetical protein Q1695_008160 [Nippostrongylus brasiliensis]|nr:hypothetical protein Q1695_008160 [Nippostrongylus brasiliensis]
MNQLWFAHYSRAKGKADTSGFEHVFIGEIVSDVSEVVRKYYEEQTAIRLEKILRERDARTFYNLVAPEVAL